MSSIIRESEKINQRQLETIKRRNEREIQSINNSHQEYKADLKNTQDAEIVEIKSANQAAIAKESDRKEKILSELKSNLQQTEELTDKELRALKDNTHKEKNTIQIKLLDERERLRMNHEAYLEDMNYRFNDSSKKVVQDGSLRLQEIKNDMHNQGQEQQRAYQDRLAKQSQDFNIRFKHDQIKNQTLKDQQVSHFKKERMQTNVRQQTEMSKMTNNHANQIEKRDQQFRKGLKEQDLFFEKKFSGQIEKQNKDFKHLESKNQKVVEGLKASLTNEMTRTAARNDDPFYKFESLAPELKYFEDRVEISVKVPDHSKQDMNLTINGKEAVVTFNRRYSDASKTSDGAINKINKVETFTSRLQTNHFLDPKSVKSTYDNDTMTYIIKKA
jgi:hypothetical protein